MQELQAGVYQHYKGKQYLVVGFARHSETDQEYVLYIPLYEHEGPKFTVRPVELFFDEVEVEGKLQARFVYLGPD